MKIKSFVFLRGLRGGKTTAGLESTSQLKP